MSVEDLENSSWSQLINTPDVADPACSNGVKLRGRFGTPFPLFSAPIYKHNIFNLFRENAGIRVYFRVLIGL